MATAIKNKRITTGLRNGSLFCFNCGGHYNLQLPQPVSIAAAIMKQFHKDHKDCPKTWEPPPVVDQSLSPLLKAMWWRDGMNGERGMSSEVMWVRFYYKGRQDVANNYHPADPDDFRRCHLLLETVPEWKGRLDELRSLSPVWDKLVDNWDTLTKMLLLEMKGESTGMYELMKSLGC